MSAKHTIQGSKVLNAVAVSGTNTYYSGATADSLGGPAANPIGTAIPYADTVSAVINFTSTPNGTLTVEVSDSSDADVRDGKDLWVTYTPLNSNGFVNGVATVTSGAIASGSNPEGVKLKPGFTRLRFKYVNSSGSGTLTIILSVKGGI